jgi:hypothetical protein
MEDRFRAMFDDESFKFRALSACAMMVFARQTEQFDQLPSD